MLAAGLVQLHSGTNKSRSKGARGATLGTAKHGVTYKHPTSANNGQKWGATTQFYGPAALCLCSAKSLCSSGLRTLPKALRGRLATKM